MTKDPAEKPKKPLVIEVAKVPPEGALIAAPLTVDNLHVQGEDTFALLPGGQFTGRVDVGDDNALHVVGRLDAALRIECGRCLDPFELPVGAPMDLYFLPDDGTELAEQDIELNERDLVVGSYQSGRLDLGEVFREQMYLGLPLKRLCREDCKGLCLSCGTNRNRGSCSCPETKDTDPRLSGLADFLPR